MRREQTGLPSLDVSDKNIRIGPLRLFLCVNDALAIARPDWVNIHPILRSVRRKMFGLTHQSVVNVDLEYRRRSRLHHECEIAAIGRPNGMLFGNLAGAGEGYDPPALWGDKKNVPLLIPVVIRH